MNVALGSDHAGVDSKARLKGLLEQAGHSVLDLGTDGSASVDYPDFAAAVARSVVAGEAALGILVCGTGIGMAISANKVAGVRAAKCNDEFEAKMSRAHNDANVLCLGERVLDPAVMDAIVTSFLAEPFEGGRHGRRVGKINALDD